MVQFWKENAEKFEEKDFQILRVLLKLLEASRETRTLAVGCHDLGMFITHHPHGRSIVTGMLHIIRFGCCQAPIAAILTGLLCATRLQSKCCITYALRHALHLSLPVHESLMMDSLHAEFRGKELVMRLMMHPDPEVQKQALLCVQKIMLARDKLEFLNTN